MADRRRIAILGRKKDTANYENFLHSGGFEPITTMDPVTAASCQGLLLPGGGDITPAFFGECDKGSRDVDTELDILQFQALELCLKNALPILGICKGMQVINAALGGTITQDMVTRALHCYRGEDQYHPTVIEEASFLYALYGGDAVVNSAHHQCVHRLGEKLRIIQRCAADNCPEALTHISLPVLGLQWHPERLDAARTTLSGLRLLSFFEAGASALS